MNKRKIFTIFILAVLIFAVAIFIKKAFFHKEVSLLFSFKKETENSFQTRISFKNNFFAKMSEMYISIYKFDKYLVPVYEYSILKSNNKAEVEFTLPPGDYLMVASTSDQSASSDNKALYIYQKFTISNDIKQSLFKQNLGTLSLEIINSDEKLPEMKIEIVTLIENHSTSDQLIGGMNKNGNKTKMNTTPGVYNINLDTLTFDEENLKTYAIGKENIIINEKEETEITLDSNNFKKYFVNFENLKYGWFKIRKNKMGDIQSMYLGKPVEVISNLSGLGIHMLYIPLQDCVDYFGKKNGYTSALYTCSVTDYRHDISAIPLQENKLVTIQQPNKLTFKTIFLNNELSGEYSIHNNQYTIYQSYVHSLWDSEIKPKIEFKNIQTEAKSESDLFNENYLEQNSNFYLKPCLDNGLYEVSLKISLDPWIGDFFNTSNTLFPIKDLNDCEKTQNWFYNFKENFSSWQKMYQDRQELFTLSEGYVLSPQKKESPIESLQPKQILTINNCSDLKILENDSLLIINLSTKFFSDEKFQQSFLNCVINKVKDYDSISIVLNNEFVTSSAYSTNRIYVSYFAYSFLKSELNNPIGILISDFFDIFFGYPDFYIYNGNISSYQMKAPYDVFMSWVSQYKAIDPLIFEMPGSLKKQNRTNHKPNPQNDLNYQHYDDFSHLLKLDRY